MADAARFLCLSLAFIGAVFVQDPAMAQGSNQFDLLCDVSFVDTTSDRAHSDKTDQKSIHLRLDLVAKRYCDQACTSIGVIQSLDDYTIVFDTGSHLRGTDARRTTTLSRITGVYYERYHYRGQGGYNGGGPCLKKPFSGFPAKRF